jgi:hypothetical protein
VASLVSSNFDHPPPLLGHFVNMIGCIPKQFGSSTSFGLFSQFYRKYHRQIARCLCPSPNFISLCNNFFSTKKQGSLQSKNTMDRLYLQHANYVAICVDFQRVHCFSDARFSIP